MTHRALAQEGPDLRREDISISPPRRRRHRHKGLAPSRSNAVKDSRLGRLSHWPVLPRPQLAGFQVSTEELPSCNVRVAVAVREVRCPVFLRGPEDLALQNYKRGREYDGVIVLWRGYEIEASNLVEEELDR